jgi:hypothetical protein
MPYFQNVSSSEFIGIYVISDRKYSKDYRIKANPNTSMIMRSQAEPFDLSTANLFVIKYSPDTGNNWYPLSVTLTSGTAKTASDVCDDLNSNNNFAAMFSAAPINGCVIIRSLTSANTTFRAYVPNIANALDATTSAEKKLLFNFKAPVVEMPSYFSKYAIGNLPGALIVQLSQPDENYVITNAGLSTTPKEDWQFLEGTSGLFTFKKQVVDGSDRVTSVIEYACGAKAGDLAKKTTYTYTSGNKSPATVAEIPYTLASGDLITP